MIKAIFYSKFDTQEGQKRIPLFFTQQQQQLNKTT